MEIVFLGTSGMHPTKERNLFSVLFRYKSENILIDCGEGTQRQIRKAKLNPGKITKILITHWHGDHILGIPGLLQTLALSGYNKTLFIYGPKGTKIFMKKLLDLFNFERNYKIKIEEVSGKFFETNDFSLEAKIMSHGIPCNAYSFIIKDKIRIDKKKLKKVKLPEGPLLQKLKEGKDINYDGKKFKSKNLTFLEKGKKISFVLDTGLNPRIVPFVKNSDLFVCDSSFESDLSEHAKKHLHLTSKQAGEIAKKSKSKKLVLTHISQRYEMNTKKVLDGARKVFKNTILVNDFDVVEVK